MTQSRGFRGDKGGFLRTAAQVTAAALVLAAMLAALWAGPAAAARSSGGQTHAAATPSPARVKYYIVPKPGNEPPVALYGIAARTLGDTHRYIEIFNLNKGRLQPNGGRLEDPRTIEPGWILVLPSDASGPGVHFGRLPAITRPATAPASHRLAPGDAVAPQSWLRSTGTGSALLLGGALILLAAAGLVIGLGRRAGNNARRKPSHAAVPQRSGDSDAAATAAAPRVADPHRPAAEHPDYSEGGDPHLRPAPGYPGGHHQGTAGPDGPRQDAPDRPGDGRWPAAEPLRPAAAPPPTATAAQNPVRIWAPADGPPHGDGPPDGTQRWSAQVARTAGAASQAYHDVGFGDGRLQVVLTDAPAGGRERHAGLGARPQDMLHLPGTEVAQLADTIRREADEYRNAHSLWLAERILSGAEDQAAEIRHEARDHAAAVRATAAQEAAKIRQQAAAARAAAEQEAAEIRQQAAAARATAEQEAAEIRATAASMTAELGRVAAYVTESLTSPAVPAAKLAALPVISPASPSQPDASEEPAHPVRRATRPAAKPATKPNGRQAKAMRKTVIALVLVFLVGAATGTAEIALHGVKFFVFRNAGAGAGNSLNLDEDQGPGQPNAPGAHHKARTTKPSSKPGSKPGNKPGKPGNKKSDKPGGKAAAKPGNKPASQAGGKAGNKPTGKAGNKPAGRPGGKPGNKPGGKGGK